MKGERVEGNNTRFDVFRVFSPKVDGVASVGCKLFHEEKVNSTVGFTLYDRNSLQFLCSLKLRRIPSEAHGSRRLKMALVQNLVLVSENKEGNYRRLLMKTREGPMSKDIIRQGKGDKPKLLAPNNDLCCSCATKSVCRLYE